MSSPSNLRLGTSPPPASRSSRSSCNAETSCRTSRTTEIRSRSHFYRWKVTHKFEDKCMGVWLNFTWICWEHPWILVQIFLADPWIDPWINPWVHLGNSVQVRRRMQNASVPIINYTPRLSFWTTVIFDWASQVHITDGNWQSQAQ